MKNENELSGKVIGCAIEVHRNLGPGLLESAYEKCLASELEASNINYELQKELSVKYKNTDIDCSYRIDLLVDNKLIIELKSVEKLLPIYEAQLLTYMKLANITMGLLINFNVALLKNGIKRFVL